MKHIDDIIESLKRLQREEHTPNFERTRLFKEVIRFLLEEHSQYKKLKVSFSTDGVRDRGIDTGIMSRELFTLFFQECLCPERGMFEGIGRTRLCIDNDIAIRDRWFYCLGKAIVLSLVSGGPSFPYLTDGCFRFLTKDGNVEHGTVFSDLTEDAKAKIMKKVQKSDNESVTNSPVSMQEISRTKFPNQSTDERIIYERSKNRFRLMDNIAKCYYVDSRSAMEQMKEGLNSLAFLERTRTIPELKHILVYHPDHCFSSEHFIDTMLSQLRMLKTTDCKEEQLKHLVANCLLSLNDHKAGDMLQYITGMRDLPSKKLKIKIAFDHQNPNEKFPRALTCGELLLLPLGNTTDEEFVRSFEIALSNGLIGFGRI